MNTSDSEPASSKPPAPSQPLPPLLANKPKNTPRKLPPRWPWRFPEHKRPLPRGALDRGALRYQLSLWHTDHQRLRKFCYWSLPDTYHRALSGASPLAAVFCRGLPRGLYHVFDVQLREPGAPPEWILVARPDQHDRECCARPRSNALWRRPGTPVLESDATMRALLTTAMLFVVTACAEIIGCYTVYLWLKAARSRWWLVPGAVSLGLFAWLLTLHPSRNAGRIYAAYGGV